MSHDALGKACLNPREKKAVLKKYSVCVQLQKTVRVWWMRFALPPEQAGWDREQERGSEESGPSKAPHPAGAGAAVRENSESSLASL